MTEVNVSTNVDVDEVVVRCEHDNCEVTSTDEHMLFTDYGVRCETHAFACEFCEDVFPDDLISDRDSCCQNCYNNRFYCERCSDFEHRDNRSIVDGDWWCDYCAGDYATWCDRHDTYHDGDHGHDNSHNVNDYGFKPMPEFHWVENDPDADRKVFMGFELEVESNGDSYDGPEIVEMKLSDLVYFKEDGSLDDGFEIVTHPMTLAFAHAMDWSWCEGLRASGYRSWDTQTCGLHVHVDRRAFNGRLHQYAFSLLLMRNRALSYLVAGREANSYASFDKDVRAEIPKYLKGQGNNMQRYSAVNVLPTSTLEVRMFRGSLKPERIQAALEYVHSAVEYSRGARSGVGAEEYLTAPAFIQWVRSRRDLYPNLVSYINNSVEFGVSDKSYYGKNRGE